MSSSPSVLLFFALLFRFFRAYEESDDARWRGISITSPSSPQTLRTPWRSICYSTPVRDAAQRWERPFSAAERLEKSRSSTIKWPFHGVRSITIPRSRIQRPMPECSSSMEVAKIGERIHLLNLGRSTVIRKPGRRNPEGASPGLSSAARMAGDVGRQTQIHHPCTAFSCRWSLSPGSYSHAGVL